MEKVKFHYYGLEEEAVICGRCGYCRDVCPAYEAGGWESFSPRGKIGLVEIMKDGDYPQRLVDRTYQCTLCGACKEACHVNIDTRKMWLDLRERIAAAGKAPAAMYSLKDTLQANGNIAGEPKENRLLWADDIEHFSLITGVENAEVLYFLGCVSSLYPAAYSIPQQLMTLLKTAKVNVTTLGEAEECCGFPLLGAGLKKEMKRFVESNVEKIVKLNPGVVVMSCPSCLHTFEHDYPELLGKELPFKVMHSSQYLLELAKQGRLRFKEKTQKITYHDPCDLGRANGIYQEPRSLLKLVPGITLIEMERNREDSMCCGGGGNLEMSDKDLAERINHLKIKMAMDTGAQTVITGCQQCKRTIAAGLRREKVRMRVQDITEFLSSCLEEDE